MQGVVIKEVAFYAWSLSNRGAWVGGAIEASGPYASLTHPSGSALSEGPAEAEVWQVAMTGCMPCTENLQHMACNCGSNLFMRRAGLQNPMDSTTLLAQT